MQVFFLKLINFKFFFITLAFGKKVHSQSNWRRNWRQGAGLSRSCVLMSTTGGSCWEERSRVVHPTVTPGLCTAL